MLNAPEVRNHPEPGRDRPFFAYRIWTMRGTVSVAPEKISDAWRLGPHDMKGRCA